MKYTALISVFILLLSSCEKGTNNNPSRSAMIGHYHFITVDFNTSKSTAGFDTGRYDGMVSILTPDDGSSISITYPYLTQQTICQTIDSSFASVVYICPGNSSPISGRYQHDTLYMTDHSYGCQDNNPNLYVSTIGIKY